MRASSIELMQLGSVIHCDVTMELNNCSCHLKGKFSIGIEGALASKLNHDLTGNNYQKSFFVFFFLCFQSLFE